eukprot:2016501-Alexandrium_andersonii.AAC.1
MPPKQSVLNFKRWKKSASGEGILCAPTSAPVLPHRCMVCDKSFKSAAGLVAHTKYDKDHQDTP